MSVILSGSPTRSLQHLKLGRLQYLLFGKQDVSGFGSFGAVGQLEKLEGLKSLDC